MDLELFQNRSEEQIERVIAELNPEQDRIERIRVMLTRPKWVYLLREAGLLCGYMVLKYDAEKRVVRCPLHLERGSEYFRPLEMVQQIKALLPEIISDDPPDGGVDYCTFMNVFQSEETDAPFVGTEPWDMTLNMRLELAEPLTAARTEELWPEKETAVKAESRSEVTKKDIGSGTEELVFCSEVVGYEELLALHIPAYAYEPPYVIGEWAELLENYLSLPDTMAITCRRKGALKGASICVEHPEGLRTRKGYGYQELKGSCIGEGHAGGQRTRKGYGYRELVGVCLGVGHAGGQRTRKGYGYQELVGVCLGVGHAEQGYHYFYSVAVLPEYQGRGLGYRLMKEYMLRTGDLVYTLGVVHSNARGLRLYEQMGFEAMPGRNYIYKVGLE